MLVFISSFWLIAKSVRNSNMIGPFQPQMTKNPGSTVTFGNRSIPIDYHLADINGLILTKPQNRGPNHPNHPNNVSYGGNWCVAWSEFSDLFLAAHPHTADKRCNIGVQSRILLSVRFVHVTQYISFSDWSTQSKVIKDPYIPLCI